MNGMDEVYDDGLDEGVWGIAWRYALTESLSDVPWCPGNARLATMRKGRLCGIAA